MNDTLPVHHVPFWRAESEGDYFDGCLRDELQCRRAYRYTYLQSVRAGLVRDAKDYPHTRVYVDLDKGVNGRSNSRHFWRRSRTSATSANNVRNADRRSHS